MYVLYIVTKLPLGVNFFEMMVLNLLADTYYSVSFVININEMCTGRATPDYLCLLSLRSSGKFVPGRFDLSTRVIFQSPCTLSTTITNSHLIAGFADNYPLQQSGY